MRGARVESEWRSHSTCSQAASRSIEHTIASPFNQSSHSFIVVSLDHELTGPKQSFKNKEETRAP